MLSVDHLFSLFHIGATLALLSLLFTLHCLQHSKLGLRQSLTLLFLLFYLG